MEMEMNVERMLMMSIKTEGANVLTEAAERISKGNRRWQEEEQQLIP